MKVRVKVFWGTSKANYYHVAFYLEDTSDSSYGDISGEFSGKVVERSVFIRYSASFFGVDKRGLVIK